MVIPIMLYMLCLKNGLLSSKSWDNSKTNSKIKIYKNIINGKLKYFLDQLNGDYTHLKWSLVLLDNDLL